MREGLRSRLVVAILALLLVPLRVEAAQPETTAAGYPDPPQVLFNDLFVAVQTRAIYSDSKAFADATPNTAPDEILAQYRAAKPDSPQALKRFVEANFILPPDVVAAAPSAPERVSITEHIDRLWGPLTRQTTSAPPYSSLLPLPRPYVVPGGRFREIYYWDSYFTMLGLVESKRRDLVENMVDDFAYLINTYGHVPNGARTYYLSRSQPPFFFAMVGLLASNDQSAAFLRYLPQLKAEYAFWMQGAEGLSRGTAHRRVVALDDGSILNRYWDDRDTPRDESFRDDTALATASRRPAAEVYRDIRAAAESGWDFSSRWFADAHTRATISTTEIVPIDLNSLMFGLENAIRAGCERGADEACTREFSRRAAMRRIAIDRYLWDAMSGAYMDYQWMHHERIRRVSAATLYPLFVALASKTQASAVAKVATHQLLRAGGIVTTPLQTGEQWDAPNGWAPLQWIAVDGLRRYHHESLAEMIACRWMSGVNEVYRADGKLVEKYDVETPGRSGGGGEYPLQDGFGWTNGVMRKFIALYPADAATLVASGCLKKDKRHRTN
jgi:alpha,alpha-trehalase